MTYQFSILFIYEGTCSAMIFWISLSKFGIGPKGTLSFDFEDFPFPFGLLTPAPCWPWESLASGGGGFMPLAISTSTWLFTSRSSLPTLLSQIDSSFLASSTFESFFPKLSLERQVSLTEPPEPWLFFRLRRRWSESFDLPPLDLRSDPVDLRLPSDFEESAVPSNIVAINIMCYFKF